MGLYSEGYLCLKFWGLIFGRVYFWRGLSLEFYGMLFASLGLQFQHGFSCWSLVMMACVVF